MEANTFSKVAAHGKVRTSKSNSADTSNEKPSKMQSDSNFDRLFNEKLTKYCPKKLFYTFLVAEDDDNSQDLLDQIYETSKEYDKVTSLTIISRDDVLDLQKLSELSSFPSHLRPILICLVENLKIEPENLTFLAEVQLLKLKLIQVMYNQYAKQIQKNEKEKNLDALLNTLTKECKRKQKKDEIFKNEVQISPVKNEAKVDPKKIKSKNEKSKDNKDEDIDYTLFPIEDDDISYGENIFDYIGFYCIKGYYDPGIIQALIEQANVPLCGVIKISDWKKGNRSEMLEKFWKAIETLFIDNTSSYKSLEKTILLRFAPSKIDENPVRVLEKCMEMLRRIVNLKLTHMRYLKHLNIIKAKHFYSPIPIECMKHYNKILKQIPSECTTVAMILDALLKEVDAQIIECSNNKKVSIPKASIKPLHCTDLLYDFNDFDTRRNIPLPSADRTFLVHENNVLTKILKSYKNIGPIVANTSLSLMKLFPIFRGLLCKDDIITKDIIHLHDQSEKKLSIINDPLEYFMYIFLFNLFNFKILPPPTSMTNHDLMKELITFDAAEFSNFARPKLISGEEFEKCEDNLYDVSMVHFRWKESLDICESIQEIFYAFNNFLYTDKKYSPATDNFLIVFSNKLDHFGTNTKVFNETVRSPVCFRDFCRYALVNDGSWVISNRTKINKDTYKIVFDEYCGNEAKNMELYSKLFKEYSYLLDKETEEPDSHKNIENHQNSHEFSEIFEDLQKCSTELNINKECGKAGKDDEMLAHDLGSNICKVSGKLITFCSHDDVKVTIDDTRFLQSDRKCSFNINSDGNTLTLHSSEKHFSKPYIFTLTLKDDSHVSFIIDKNNFENESNERDRSEIDGKIIENVVAEATDNYIEIDELSQTEKEPVVHYVNEEYINKIMDNKSLEDFPIEEKCDLLLKSIINAQENGTIYKITPKPKYLESRMNNLKVPLETAFRNILCFDKITPEESKRSETFTKRFRSSKGNKSDSKFKRKVDFRICLPNGLYIRPYLNIVNENVLVIKQEYVKEKPDVSLVQHEEFRLFIDQGLVLIKKTNGTITILKSNGDILDFEKPNDFSGESEIANACHFTIENYRNKLNKLQKEQELCSVATSRRGHITGKHNHILDNKILKILGQFDVPYFKKSITKFDGKRINIQGDKISQRQIYHLTSQQDFFTGEIFFERDDNFHSLFYRSASQKIFFPDGTVILSSIDIADELVDGFVYINISYQYEHPHYATVKFNFDKTCEIGISDNVVIKETSTDQSGGFEVKMDKGISVSVEQQSVNFQKNCKNCGENFNASFNIQAWNPVGEFLHVEDTYGKHFYSDFIGNCHRNINYLKGSLNSQKCNHHEKAKYKQLFVIDKKLGGEMFSTNDSVRTKIAETQKLPNGHVTTYTMIANKHDVWDCRQNFYSNYAERFQNKLTLEYSEEKPFILYTTYRAFQKLFVSADEIARYLGDMQDVYLNETFQNTKICSNMDNLTNALQVYYKKYQNEVLHEERESLDRKKKYLEEFEKRKLPAQCTCTKKQSTIQEKFIKVHDICNKLRQKIQGGQILPYYSSDFVRLCKK